jgi:hypothetical protein
MAATVQVTFDCGNPHALARFWAEVLGYEKEDHRVLVTQLLASGAVSPVDTVEVDGGAQFADVAASCHPKGQGPRLFFQRVPEGKLTKNRLHLDLHVGADRFESEIARLEALGARKLWFSDDRGGACWTMADIEGNEFCVN